MVTSSSLRALMPSRSSSRVAKYALRRLAKAFLAADSRFQSTASAARSPRGAAFHSSSSCRIRSPLAFQWVASTASRSASATMRSLISERLALGLLAGSLVLFLAMLDRSLERGQAGRQAVQIADAMGVGDGGDQPADGRLRLGRRQVGVSHPLLKQADLGLQRVELALEEGQRLVRAARLPGADLALAVGYADIDSPVVGYPAPRIACGAHRVPPDRYLTCNGGQVFVIVTLSIWTFSLGAPSPGPLEFVLPALATFWMMDRPLATVPNGV